MSNSPNVPKGSLFSRAVAGLVLVTLAAACDTPTAPSRIPTTPTQTAIEPGPNRPDLTGTYTMTLTASSSCRLQLPESIRTRTYTATIAQAGGALTVKLSGPDSLAWDRFPGAVGENDEVVFQLLIWELSDMPVVEFVASGGLTTTISAGGLSGLLDGSLDAIVLNEGGRGSTGATCAARDHGVVFSR